MLVWPASRTSWSGTFLSSRASRSWCFSAGTASPTASGLASSRHATKASSADGPQGSPHSEAGAEGGPPGSLSPRAAVLDNWQGCNRVFLWVRLRALPFVGRRRTSPASPGAHVPRYFRLPVPLLQFRKVKFDLVGHDLVRRNGRPGKRDPSRPGRTFGTTRSRSVATYHMASKSPSARGDGVSAVWIWKRKVEGYWRRGSRVSRLAVLPSGRTSSSLCRSWTGGKPGALPGHSPGQRCRRGASPKSTLKKPKRFSFQWPE